MIGLACSVRAKAANKHSESLCRNCGLSGQSAKPGEGVDVSITIPLLKQWLVPALIA